MAVHYRRLRAGDASLIHDLIAAESAFDPTATGDAWTRDELVKWLSEGDDVCVGAFVGPDMRGVVLSHLHRAVRKVHVENLYVAPACRRMGIARELMTVMLRSYAQQADDWLPTRYVGLIEPDNLPIRALLNGMSFEEGATFIWAQRGGE